MEALIVYYSYSGNTRKVAKLLAERLHAESAEIETATAYPSAYDAVVKQGKDEIRRGYLPELKPLGKNPEHYDTIFLGTPVWWYTLAPAVKAFLSRHSLA